MIKQLRYLCTLLLMAVASVAWGEVGDVVYTFATEKNTSNTAYASNYDVTIDELTWSVPGNQSYDGYVRIGGKSLTNVDRLITGKSPISAAIGKITVNHKGISNANLIVNKVTLTVASDADFSNVIDTKVLTPTFDTGVEGSFDFDPSSTGWPENCYYKFTFNFTNSKSSNYGLDVKSIVFYEGVAGEIQEKTDPNLSFSSDAITADLNESFTPPTLSNEENVDVYWNSSASNVASVDEDGNVTLLAEGTTTITASFDGDDDYKASSASYTLTVVDGSLTTIWSEDWSDLTALPSEGNNATYEFNSVGATFYADQNTAGGTAPEIMLKKNGGALTVTITSLQTCTGDLTLFYYTNQDSKLAITASDENIAISESTSLGTKAYKRTISLNGATSLVLTFTASDANTNVRLDNLELKGAPTGVVKENAEIENFEDQTIDVEAGDDLEISFAATATSNATVTYAVAEGGSFVENDDFRLEGNVLTIITNDKDGTIKITASAEETEEFLAASKTITITVKAPARTLENIADLTALTTEGEYTLTLTDALVTYVNGTNGYIEDASGAVMLYGADAVGEFVAGDKITGTATVYYKPYKNLPELTALTLAEGYTKTSGNTVTPAEVTIAEMNENYSSYLSRYVKIVDATVVSAFADKNSTIKQGDATIVLRDQNSTATLETTVDDVVTVTAHPSIFNTTKQIAVYEQSQIVVKQDDRAAAEIAFNPETLTITQGDKEYTTPEFLNPNEIALEEISFTSSNANIADWDDSGLVLGSEIGTATITATFKGNTTYKPATATLVVTVNENLNFVDVVIGSGIYQKVSSASDLEAGKRYLIVGYKASETAYYAYNGFDEDTSKKYGLAATVTVNNDRIDNTESAATPIVLQKRGNNWFLMDGDNFLAYNLPAGTNKNNNLFAVSDATDDGTSWIIDFESENGYLITSAYNTERSLEFNSDRFACYKHNQQDVVLYKELGELAAYAVVAKNEEEKPVSVTFYYDDQKANREGTIVDITDGTTTGQVEVWNPQWDHSPFGEQNATLKAATFDKSFKDFDGLTSLGFWFACCSNLESITGLEYVNTSNVTTMCRMFYNCNKLDGIDVSNFNTSKVTNMGAMFYGCNSLSSIDVSNFNTANVTEMAGMFKNCSSLKTLDLSNFNTAQVKLMSTMFQWCSSLETLILGENFKTTAVTGPEGMRLMFSNCAKLKSIDLSSFDTSQVVDMMQMFYGCKSLTTLDLSNFNTAKVTDMRYMFGSCENLTTIYVGNGWTTEKVTEANSENMFNSCTKLIGGAGTGFDSSKAIDKTCAILDGGAAAPGYLTSKDVPEAPTMTLGEDGKTVTITAAEGTTIYYTLDGTDPNAQVAGQVYTEPIELSATTTITAIAVKGAVSQATQQTFEMAASTGDVNKDGKVTIADVTALVNIILGKDDTTPYQYDHGAANVNRDEGITIADVTALVNIILGKTN